MIVFSILFSDLLIYFAHKNIFWLLKTIWNSIVVRPKRISVRVKSETWKVVFKRPTEDDYIGVEEDDIGLCVEEEKKILVDPDPSSVLSTAIHEVLHAVYPQLSEDAIIDGEDALVDLLHKFPQELLHDDTQA